MAPSEQPSVALPAGFAVRPLVEADIPSAMLLSAEAGWNQIAADWRIFIELGSALAVTSDDGRLIATAATLPYGDRFGWISMVLVTARHRRRGIASWLLRSCIETLLRDGLVPVLDATPAGRTVYSGLGFEDSWGMRRLVSRGLSSVHEPEAPRSFLVRPLSDADWPELIAYDSCIFGADRRELLRRLAARLPSAALVAERNGRIVGYLLGRDGRVMAQLGPLAVEDDAIAQALIARASADLSAPVAIDIPDRHGKLGRWLAACGFMPERPLIRMVYGQRTAFDDTSRLFAIAGPELG